MKHYVYRLTIQGNDCRRYYVGKHSGGIDDLHEGRYKTSSKKVSEIFDENLVSIKIVKEFDTAEEALIFEGKYHERVNAQDNQYFFNQQNQFTGGKLDRTGRITVVSVPSGERMTISLDEYRKNPGNYLSDFHGKVFCRSKKTGKVMRVDKDEFISDEDLIGINFGKMHVVDRLSNKRMTISKDDYEPELHKHQFSGISAYDKITGKIVYVEKSEFQKDRYVGVKTFTKEGVEKCSICGRDISRSNLQRHFETHDNKMIWVTDNSNTNTVKVSERHYYENLVDTHYMVPKGGHYREAYVDGTKTTVKKLARGFTNEPPKRYNKENLNEKE